MGTFISVIDDGESRRVQKSAGYEVFILVLCLFALVAIGIQGAVSLDPEIEGILDFADNFACAIFLMDFLFSLWVARNRWEYFRTWGWLDLLSSIPMLDAARWGRLARIARIIRVLRGLRATKILTTAILRRRAENTFLAAMLFAILLIVICSTAVLHFERVADSNIRTAEDAIWWAFTTVTTVGYGDRFPVTSEGRFVASLLMFAGVGLFSTFSGFLAAWFLAPEKEESSTEIEALRGEIVALRQTISSALPVRDGGARPPAKI